MTTEELIQRCANKDHGAWDEFVRRYHNLVVRSVGYKLNRLGRGLPRSEADDIVQEIFLSIWESNRLANIKNRSTIKTWLAMVSVNFTSNYCKRRSFHSRVNTLSLDENQSCEGNDMMPHAFLPSSALDAEETIKSNDLSNILRDEISKLETKKQLALKFYVYHGKKYKDIARIMHMPEKTVATLINRAKKSLKENFKDFLKEK